MSHNSLGELVLFAQTHCLLHIEIWRNTRHNQCENFGLLCIEISEVYHMIN